MLINRNIQMLGTILLVVAATLVTISAIRPAFPIDLSWPARPDFSILAKSDSVFAVSNQEGLAQYYSSERGAAVNAQNGLAIYHQSERYAPAAVRNGLAIYHQSERMQPVKWTLMTSKWNKFHQSEGLK